MNEVFNAFSSIYKTFKLSGFLVYEISQNGIKFSFKSIFQVLSMNLLILILFYYRLKYPEEYFLQGSPVSKNTLALSYLFPQIFYDFIVILFVIYRNEFFEMIKSLGRINQKVKKIGIFRSCPKKSGIFKYQKLNFY